MKAVVAMPDPRVTLDTLPIELRQTIYRLVFTTSKPVRITNAIGDRAIVKQTAQDKLFGDMKSWNLQQRLSDPTYARPSSCQGPYTVAGLLLASRAFNREASEFLYHCQDFVFDSMKYLLDWLSRIGNNVK
jgi:hypothetical protein